MPDFIVLRLTPSTPVDAATFTKYLVGLSIKAYEISNANSRSGLPGDLTLPIDGVHGQSAVYKDPTPVIGVPFMFGGIYMTYPADTTIAQHYEPVVANGIVVNVKLKSVATAVIPYLGGAPEYVAPDLRIEFDRGGATRLRDPNVYYNVKLLTAGAAPDPGAYGADDVISSADVSAYLSLRAPGQLILPADGSPPNYDELMATVKAVLSQDPGGAPTPAQIAALTVDQCKNIAFEIIYGPQPPLPPLTALELEDMYTNPPNDGSNTNANEQSRQDFQGKLNSYYSTNNATAQRLTNFVYSLAAAVWCEQRTQSATRAIVSFPVNPNPATPPKLPTVAQAQAIFTGALGADVPASYFYALTARMPAQITPDQRYKIATTADAVQVTTQLNDAVASGIIAPPGAMNVAQAARLLAALNVPSESRAVEIPVADIQPIWTHWLAFAGSDMAAFWPAEETAQHARYLDLVLFVLTERYVAPLTGLQLAAEIETNLRFGAGSSISKVADVASATPANWHDFFAPPGPPAQPVQVNLLPPFTLPGTPEARAAAFIRHVQKFFDMPASAAAIGPAAVDSPDSLHTPTLDLIAQCLAVFGGLTFGTPLSAADHTNLAAAAASVIPDDPAAQKWLFQTIVAINDAAILANIPGQPDALRFSIMEALYARGFTSVEDVHDLSLEDFSQALTGTVAYDFAATIYANAGGIGGAPPSPPGSFTPINPGLLVNCIPPRFLSPLGPIEYLAELLRLSEASTCDDPFAAPAPGHMTLGAAVAARRGPIGSLQVTRQNLETEIPLIDIVNECLELMAAAAPPATVGVVYNTAADALGGHTLCSGECCCGGKGCAECESKPDAEPPDEGRVGLHACHKPALLFEALPQYSTPATPVAENAAVEPAVYNKLKKEFSSCYLPYSQALDVSRTYLRYFKSCRFEEMRTFRCCITEFVLDPVAEPAGFQSHLWRYPVRVDIAIEYLGITPEEYAVIFNGAQPAPCGGGSYTPNPDNLTGEIPNRDVPIRDGVPRIDAGVREGEATFRLLRLPDLLKELCLSYCEFFELWLTGFIPFRNAADRKNGKFPPCEPCCLEDYGVQFTDEEGSSARMKLMKLIIFVRLWHKLKERCCSYTFAQLQDICLVLKLFDGNAVNRDFIRQLAAFEMLRDHFRMPLADASATIPANATGAARTHLLALWDPAAPAKWDWAVGELIGRIKYYAECKHHCRARGADFLKLLPDTLDRLSRLAGFDTSAPDTTWHALPTHTLRFAEVLAKIYASDFGIGEILYLFTADPHLEGDDPFVMQQANEAMDDPLELPDDDRDHALWRLRRALFDVHVDDASVHHWTWNRIEAALRQDFGYDAAEVAAFGEHFFPDVLERAGHPVPADKIRFVSALNPADTNSLMWNAPGQAAFQYDVASSQLCTRLPLSDDVVIEQLAHVRKLQANERQAVQDLYFQPRAMLARFALLFDDFPAAQARLIESDNKHDRWKFFQHQFTLFEARARIIAEHLTAHVAAATKQPHPEGIGPAVLVLRSLLADENENQPGTDWEDDAGHAPPVKWSPPPNGSALGALLGLVGTGLLVEFSPADGGPVVWRETSNRAGGFGRVRNLRNCPVPTVLPALDAALTPEQEQFVAVQNGLAIKAATGAALGGATGFRATLTGALLVRDEGTYEFHARAPRAADAEDEEPSRRRWCVTIKRGQRKTIVARRNWSGQPDIHSGSLHLLQGAYDLMIEFVHPTPLFDEEDDIFPARTGFEVEYSGPDTGNERTAIPHHNLMLYRKDGPLGHGIAGLSAGASAFLAQYYPSSLRDIRRTYQRAFKALLFVHRFALSAGARAGGQSELGYMLAKKSNFAGASYYDSGAGYKKHNADFDSNLLPLWDDYRPPSGDSRTAPSLRRRQALFDWWERVFDYVRVRADVENDCHHRVWTLWAEADEKKPAHPAYLLRQICADSRHWAIDSTYFQNQLAPVYHLTSVDLEDDRWTVRAWHADRWTRAMLRSFRAKDVTAARPDLWASDDPSAVLPSETVTGNANLSKFLIDGLIENGEPRCYTDLKKLNDGLRERGRRALLCYLTGPGGITDSPKQISEMLLLDVEAGICEKASRIEDAITAVQTFIRLARLNVIPGWTISKKFALLWDREFQTYRVWEACKLRKLYKENWIEWYELDKAKKIEAFRFLDEQLRRVTLTIAAPGGVDYWPDARPPVHPGLQLLQQRDLAIMQLLQKPREGLDLLASPERAGQPSWLTTVPEAVRGDRPAGVPDDVQPAALLPAAPAQPTNLPSWMEAAIALGTRFVRIAAAGYPPASAPFEPRKENAKDDKSCCVDCCTDCGRVHAPIMDEYYFWLVDARHFGPQTQEEHYDQNLQVCPPWHDCDQLTSLLSWPSDPMVRLAWCRVHNGEFQQPRRSDFGIPYTPDSAVPDLSFRGRAGDSLYFEVSVPATALAPNPGFRYDIATDRAARLYELTVPAAAPGPYPGNLFAYPFFAYFSPGARLFPWATYAPSLAVAHALRAHCRFEAALRWYALSVDPLNRDNIWMRCEQTPQVLPREPDSNNPPGVIIPQDLPVNVGGPAAVNIDQPGGATIPQGSMCCDSTDVSCLVGRERSILLHYLETMLQWADALIRRNSPEAFQQARVVLGVMAKILGKHPRSIWNTPGPVVQTVDSFVPLFPPLNPRLMNLYDRLDDRLALIHACINARRFRNGRDCPVPYFGNDTFREGWRTTDQVCLDEGDWCAPPSPYRFLFLAQKAREITTRVRELGAALLAAFEKGDAEYLAAIRARHEHELVSLALKARQDQWRDADWQVQALRKTKENRQSDRRYYAQLIQNGLINNETQYLSQTDIAQGNRSASIAMEAVAEGMDIIPDLFVGFPCEETWIPVGTKLAGMFKTIARISSVLAEIASVEGSRDLTLAGWDRRVQDWVHRVESLDIEIEQIELQILGAERRRSQNLREINVQQATIENAAQTQNFLRDKLSSHAVYLCIQKETAELYWRMYELALHAFRQAERKFNLERGHTSRRFLPAEPWDTLHEGLLAGDRLDAALALMEKEYLDLNVREEELTKHISLKTSFPFEFLQLKITGRCEIRIPEWMFDQDYPGHYMRRIKNVSLTIPGVTGPYTGVHCRLTLLGSATRVDPALSPPAAHCCNECTHENAYDACPHDPRVVRQYGAYEAIATSSGRNDTGLFELNFRDERYLPFEFHGAVSCWRFELPPENNFFDTNSITECVMHMNYTAREGGDVLRRAASESARKWLPGACWAFFNIRQDFAGAWEQFRSSCLDEHGARDLVLEFTRNMFPFVPGSPEIRVDQLALLFESSEHGPSRCIVPECPCPEKPCRAAHTLDVFTTRVDRHGRCEREDEEDMTCLAGDDWPELYHGVMAVRFGPFSPHSGARHRARFHFRGDVGHVTRAYLFCHYCVDRLDECQR